MTFDRVIGTGGIGTGILFQMDGNEPLGRNESRPAVLSDTKDYCKQHIILHYIAKTMYPDVDVYAIGMVGSDAPGAGLFEEMQKAHIHTDCVERNSAPTLFSVCMQYTDKAVCNVTSSNSASAMVDATYIQKSLAALPQMNEKTIVLAVPEVSLSARLTLLERGHANGAYCVASFLNGEAGEFVSGGGAAHSSLLSLNEEEAAAFGGARPDDIESVLKSCEERINELNPALSLIVTCGAAGSYCITGGKTEFIPAHPAEVIATGGAGDAYIAGVICGLCIGLPLISERSATRLGAHFAKKSVEHKDTITPTITPNDIKSALHGVSNI